MVECLAKRNGGRAEESLSGPGNITRLQAGGENGRLWIIPATHLSCKCQQREWQPDDRRQLCGDSMNQCNPLRFLMPKSHKPASHHSLAVSLGSKAGGRGGHLQD